MHSGVSDTWISIFVLGSLSSVRREGAVLGWLGDWIGTSLRLFWVAYGLWLVRLPGTQHNLHAA